MAHPLQLSLACSDCDRTRPLADGRVRAEGIDLTVMCLPVEEVFFRMLRYREFDVAEMSLSSYTMSVAAGNPALVAIPVFLSRSFRHSAIYINTGSGIATPRDLIGKRVGVPEFQVTAAVWIRGILADHYGVPVDGVTYFTGGVEEPGRPEKVPLQLPPNIRVESIGDRRTLAQMLAAGEIDALYAPRIPSPFARRSDRVARLFADYPREEQAYFAQTGIFPIMHTVVIRRELYERHPWVARSLYKAFAQARDVALAGMDESATLKVILPWLPAHLEETRQVMGDDYWAYGLDANRHVLQTFLRYHHEQGLSPRLLTPEDLFATETFEAFKI